jgi:hypothetical protein
MARSRNIKPGFFTNEVLGPLSPYARLLFAALWGLADREGRLEDRPLRIKVGALPYDNVDVDLLLNDLAGEGFIARYSVNGKKYIQVINFLTHQSPHGKEKQSEIPAMPNSEGIAEKPVVKQKIVSDKPQTSTRQASGKTKTSTSKTPKLLGKTKSSTRNAEKFRPDSFNLIPDSLNLIPIKDMHGEMRSPPCPSILSMQLQDKSDYEITQDQVERWKELYPAVDILQELRKMAGWCEASPNRRKTKAGILRFITGWLGRVQDKGGNTARTGDYPKNYDAGKDFFDT